MKNLKVTNKELMLIEAGLELRNNHNINILNGNYPKTFGVVGVQFGEELKILANEEKKIIDNLIDIVRCAYKAKDEVKEAEEGTSLTMTIKLDTTEFEESLNKLGKKLLILSEM